MATTGTTTGRDAPHSTTQYRNRKETTSADSLKEAVQIVEHKIEQAALLIWDQLPTWRRDNQFIISGYRADSNSYRSSFASVLAVHNESVNIWTHVFGATAFLFGSVWLFQVVARRYETASSSDVLVFSCFFTGAVLCLGMSATYHTISNHSQDVAKWGNKLDYSGIVLLIVGSYVPALYYGLFCHPGLMTIYLGGIFLLGLACGVVSWVESFRTPAWRPYRAGIFVGLGASGVVPVCHALGMYGYRQLDEQMGLSWVLLQGGLYIFGAFLYAARWPERNFPGKFDIWGSSHQLFHILIVFAAASHLTGMIKAFDHHHAVMGSQCPL
ncbi:hemolysin-III related-domain-containing protein [Microdochium trichocladiopsis]|uniref:Hemolysin-III related-domain-containing protein n=1 Tax=Microdochium trichocladiopsis TaxID=1682393 RepID=A0A9P8YC84_9PEZI|nr:hemolysin-III related-domain-containing protein [Microdochium trichocladiopsis]KAH7035240.1 hemolysin-III related-domain-containing protein [Microdochium trichocladiopsis]